MAETVRMTHTASIEQAASVTWRVGHVVDGKDEDEIPDPGDVRAVIEIVTADGHEYAFSMTSGLCEVGANVLTEAIAGIESKQADLR